MIVTASFSAPRKGGALAGAQRVPTSFGDIHGYDQSAGGILR